MRAVVGVTSPMMRFDMRRGVYTFAVYNVTQNASLTPSWICRDVVTVEVMRPQVGATMAEPSAATPVNAMRPDGTAKLGWFGRLKHSTRSWSDLSPPSANDLISDRSTDT